MGSSYLGSRISLISKAEIRYEGILYSVDQNESTVALSKVKSHGTEDRVADRIVPARDEVFEYIIFRGADIKDLHVSSPPSTPLNESCNSLQSEENEPIANQQSLGQQPQYYPPPPLLQSPFLHPPPSQNFQPPPGLGRHPYNPLYPHPSFINNQYNGFKLDEHLQMLNVNDERNVNCNYENLINTDTEKGIAGENGKEEINDSSTLNNNNNNNIKGTINNTNADSNKDSIEGTRKLEPASSNLLTTPTTDTKKDEGNGGIQPQVGNINTIGNRERSNNARNNKYNSYRNVYNKINTQATFNNHHSNNNTHNSYNNSNIGYSNYNNKNIRPFPQNMHYNRQKIFQETPGMAGRWRKEYDFEGANARFDKNMVQHELKKITHDNKNVKKEDSEVDKRNNEKEGDHKVVGADEEEEEEEEEVDGFYNKQKSFFDNISCNSNNKRSRNNWKSESVRNCETFGLPAPFRGGVMGRGGGSGYDMRSRWGQTRGSYMRGNYRSFGGPNGSERSNQQIGTVNS